MAIRIEAPEIVEDCLGRSYSEFEIQAEAYMRLKDFYGPFVRGEYCIPKDPNCGTRGARFDICLIDTSGIPYLVLEIKKRKQNKKGRPLKQIIRYQNLVPCPVLCIRGMAQAQNIVSTVQQALRSAYADEIL